jgi:hypothetical protein
MRHDPAFPCEPDRGGMPGMSKREVAAISAMQGLLANPHPQVSRDILGNIAHLAVQAADLLLDELEKPRTVTQEEREKR